MILLINEKLSSIEESKQQSRNIEIESSDLFSTSALVPTTKLPAIQSPTFYREYQQWISFEDLFTLLVHNNANISKVNKCHCKQSQVWKVTWNLSQSTQSQKVIMILFGLFYITDLITIRKQDWIVDSLYRTLFTAL